MATNFTSVQIDRDVLDKINSEEVFSSDGVPQTFAWQKLHTMYVFWKNNKDKINKL